MLRWCCVESDSRANREMQVGIYRIYITVDMIFLMLGKAQVVPAVLSRIEAVPEHMRARDPAPDGARMA